MKQITVNGKTKYQADDGKVFDFMTFCVLHEIHNEATRPLTRDEILERDEEGF